MLAQRRPEGAVEALLAFLPSAETEAILDEVKKSLLSLAVHDGKVDAALLAALQDKLSVRRAAAAEVLAQLGPNTPDAELKKLLPR